MAKDYFQDITPPSHDTHKHPHKHAHDEDEETSDDNLSSTNAVPIRVAAAESRGIRSISAPQRAHRHPTMTPTHEAHTPRPRRSKWWTWGAAIAAVLVVAGLLLFAFRPTTVTITPRSHTIVLTNATAFTAYPAATAATGALAYTVQSIDLQDSAVVPVSGTTTSAAAKASGSITVYNSYSASSVRLVKTTRFETPDGLIFRAPADIVVPGKTAAGPGSVNVTVVADQNGDQYNVGAVSRFTLPGLKSTTAMYTGVYAKSTAAMTGGSSGVSGPGVDPSVEAAAIAQLKTEMTTKATASVAQAPDGKTALPDLMQITFTRGANTPEAGGQARIQETAHAEIPLFDSVALGEIVGAAVSADSDNSAVTITPQTGFAAQLSGGTPALGTDPLQFTLTGQAQLIWSIDTMALQQALAGRDEGAFQTVIGGFSGIAEAHAKIEPFWNKSFPSDPSKIKVVLTAPSDAQ